ncbi:hypothetical protein J1786_21495 [Rahnella sp. L72c]|uniref:Uncharacterized protein n=1 Tax=Rahnella perminowiae TaxID=2816244 RepID=A0ABS6L6F9_9GAMM|nr:hypothetical protein [Rahnella perminowiae]MBU9837374.1 hypothetical protein [Rahnella perminowiae]
MDNFEETVRKIKAEVAERGIMHSSLIYNKLADHYRPYYKEFSQSEKERLLLMLRRTEKEVGLTKPFDWEDALKS